ncbi:SDR family oxidoreductase [Antarcticirhabdus aurantiaca]|uniref:SDR family oxidoreductase n=1 Tax=Antarcticirhabdus aurantiaca TaxID=2606717 RepID=A0ACD4NTZ4_9HYPH|nr:SDR family oxidoreductase [Antarcticirhabdus aurantiaca]WAJ30336.1 SDR family oxidoreductase [Jeongeuplla avenae]
MKRVVITGASSGIGAATAEAFAAAGAQLVLAARGKEALDVVAERCWARGAEVLTVPVDVADADAVAALARAARDWMGGIDVWFSNVGVGVVGRFHEVPIEAHRRVIESNLVGHLNDAHAVLSIFIQQRRGIFINMISVGGFLPAPWAVAYTASKFGLRGMSQALRGELSAYPGIHVCDVYPTFVDTPAIRHAGNYTGGETSVPPGVLDPRTVARAVVRLADRPRPTTAVGAPAGLMSLAQVLAPNLGATAMNAFLGSYFRRAVRTGPTDGNLFAPPADDGAIDGGFRRPDQRRQAAGLAAIAGVAALGGLALLLGRSGRGTRRRRLDDRWR